MLTHRRARRQPGSVAGLRILAGLSSRQFPQLPGLIPWRRFRVACV